MALSFTSAVSRISRLLLAAAFGWLAATQLGGVLADISPGSIAGLLSGLLLGGPAQLLIHELGHALGGVSAGLRLLIVVVGKFVYLPDSGVRVEADRPFLFGVTGLLPHPEMTLPHILRGMRASVVSGPLLGLLFSAACWFGFAGLISGGLKVFLGVTALMGAYLHLTSLLPGTRHGFLTDGAQLLLLWPGSETAEPRAAVSGLLARLELQRPRDWPTALVQAAGRPQGETGGGLLALQFTVNHALDTGALDHAETLLAQARELNAEVRAAQRSSFWVEETYLLARQGRAEEARARLDALGSGPCLHLLSGTRLRVEAAVLLAEGRKQEAVKTIETAQNVLHSPGIVEVLEAGFLEDLAAEISGGHLKRRVRLYEVLK